MPETTVQVDLKGITFDVTVSYNADDPTYWEHASAQPVGDDADFLGFIQAVPDLFSEFDRQVDRAMNEFQGTRYDGIE